MSSTLTALSCSVATNVSWSVQLQPAGPLSPVSDLNTTQKKFAYSLGTTTAQTINDVSETFISLAAGGTSTLSVAACTDAVNQTINFARIKGMYVQLLNTTDDAVNGLTSQKIKFGPAAALGFNWQLGGGTGTNAPTYTLFSGDVYSHFSQSGTGVPTGTTPNIVFTNLDGTNSAAITVILLGSVS